MEDLELGNEDKEDDGVSEYIQYYGLKITTNKSRCTIDYRNSSNGYYGGYLDLVSPLPKDDD